MGIAKDVGGRLAPKVTKVAPDLTAGFVNQALDRAIRGVSRLPGAAAAADAQLRENDGNVDRAIHDLIENHVRYAGAEGFVTNLGGLVTMTVTVPANIAGLALIQCRMVAGIAHLRGYDLDDPRTRTAILACLLGEEKLLSLIKAKKMAGTPMALATAPVNDPELGRIVANEVAGELISKVAGKKLATRVGRRVPVFGGVVGAGTDAFSTWRVGRYVDRELLPRSRR
jgi:uncharacterized protein (DUF697 family)